MDRQRNEGERGTSGFGNLLLVEGDRPDDERVPWQRERLFLNVNARASYIPSMDVNTLLRDFPAFPSHPVLAFRSSVVDIITRLFVNSDILRGLPR